MATVNDGMHIEVTASSIGAKEAFEETRQSLELISAAILSLNNRFDDLRAQSSKPIKLSWGNEVANGMEQAGFYIERGFSKIVKGLTVAASAIGGTIAAVTKSALNVGGGFETQMTRVKIISGATAEDLEALTKKAREMGESLPITAQEAASAMELLAQRGTQAKDILASVADVSALAISQNVGMAEASELLGATMTNFGIAIEKASQVTDIFNNASNQSALNMSKLAEGLKYVGPAASAAGMKLEEAVAAMEVLANAGLSGEMIGTGLSMTLSKIAASSSILGVKTRELDGTMRPLKDIFVELQARGLTLADASKVFGERAAKAALNLAKYSGSLEENERNLQKWGSTQKAVTEQLGTFENVFKGLQSAVEGVRLEIFDQIKEESKDAVGGITELTRAFRAWIGETQIASKTLKGFLSGLGVDIPSGDEFKKMLASFDVTAFVERMKGFGGTLREIGAGFVSLFNTVKGPLAFLLKNIDAFAKVSFWGWIIGKGLRVPKTLGDIGSAFGGLTKYGNKLNSLISVLNTPIKASMFTSAAEACKLFLLHAKELIAIRWATLVTQLQVVGGAIKAAFDVGGIKAVIASLSTLMAGPLATIGVAVAGIGTALHVANKYMKAHADLQQAQKKDLESQEDLTYTNLAVRALAMLKTGYEDIGAILDTFPEKQKKWLLEQQKGKQNKTLEALKAAMQEYNDSLDETRQHLKVSEDDVEHWAGRMMLAANGSAEAMNAIQPQLQEIVRIYREATGAVQEQGKAANEVFKKQDKSVRESVAEFRAAQDQKKASLLQSFKSDISTSIRNLLEQIPRDLAEANEYLGGKGIDLAVNFQFEDAQEKLKKFISETAEKLSISEGVVKVGVFNELEKLARAGNRAAQALADGLGVADKRVDDLVSSYRNAVEYLEESPAKFLPALKSMVNGLNKVDPVTGKMSEAFKKAKKALKEFADMTFDKLKSRIQQIKEAVEGGFVDRKALEAEFKGAFEKAQLKVTAELLPRRGEYQDPKVFSGVLVSEIKKEMESIGGKGYGDKAVEELRKLMERFGGDLGRYFEDQKRIAERREKYDLKPQAQQAQRSEPQRPQEQDKTQGIVQGIVNGFAPFVSKLEGAQSGQAAAAQSLANAMTPITSVLQALIGKLGAVQGAVTANTTALAGVAGALEKAGSAGGASQKTAPSIHIEINQNGFIIQKRDDAGLVANLAAGALRTGLGNAM